MAVVAEVMMKMVSCIEMVNVVYCESCLAGMASLSSMVCSIMRKVPIGAASQFVDVIAAAYFDPRSHFALRNPAID